jgi:hypothetical protein
MQAADRVTDGVEHPLDLAIAPFVNRQLDPVIADAAHLRGRGHAVVELHSLAQRTQHVLARTPADLGLVDLLDLVARVGEPVRERAVVREQERAGRVGVEPSHRHDTRALRHELDNRGTALWIACGRHDACRLVQEQIGEPLQRHRRTVDLDAVVRLDKRVQLTRLSVDEHAARLDQIVGATTRRDTGPGEIRVESHD